MSDEELCAIASTYVEKEFFCKEMMQSPFSGEWTEIVCVKSQETKIGKRTDDGIEVSVKVLVSTIFYRDEADPDDEDAIADETHLISCWLERDSNGEWYVENAEE